MQGWRRVNKSTPCPICQRPNNCEISEDGALVHCRRVADGAKRELANGAGWMHQIGEVSNAYAYTPVITRRDVQKANPDILHAVYSSLLARLSLIEEHRAHLMGQERQMSMRQIKRRGYKSLLPKGRSGMAQELACQFGEQVLLSVPGFYVRGGRYGSFITFGPRVDGILCPFKDVLGRIGGFQLRPVPTGDTKYFWVSSKKYDGPGPGGGNGLPSHVAKPNTGQGGKVWITEGPIKADIASDILRETMIAVPGVSAWGSIRLFDTLRHLGPESVVVAFDADDTENAHVHRAKEGLGRALVASGYRVQVARWDLNQGKGIDDLLLGGGRPSLSKWDDLGKKKIITIPADAVSIPERAGSVSLGKCREMHKIEIDRQLRNPKPGVLFLESTTGTGKTTTIFNTLKDLWQNGWPQAQNGQGGRPLRIMFVTDTRAQIEELIQAHPWIDEAMRKVAGIPFAAVRMGRDETNCKNLEVARAMGAGRHSVKAEVCNGCEFNDLCLYMAIKESAEQANLVLSTKDAAFTNPNELKKFDVIIADEDLARCLFDEIPILAYEHIDTWFLGMNSIRARNSDAFGDRHPHRAIFNMLQAALMNRSELFSEPYSDWLPLVPVLEKYSDGRKNLIEMARLAVSIGPDKYGRYQYEAPFHAGDGTNVVPLKLGREFFKLLLEDAERPTGADTRLWLTPEGVRVMLFRSNIVEILKNRTLINLDATPAPIWNKVFPNAKHLKIDVHGPVEIIQIKDNLGSRRNLQKGFDRFNAAIEEITRDAQNPVVFGPKSHNPEDTGRGNKWQLSNPRAVFGHYGKDERATNREDFQNADVLVVVGMHAYPPPDTRARVQAIRNSVDAVALGEGAETLRAYQGYEKNGKGFARKVKADQDQDVEEAINHQIRAVIIQTMGRARSVLRNIEEDPLKIYILSSWPVSGVKVDRLVALSDLAQMDSTRYSLEEWNAKRHNDAVMKVEKAVGELLKNGKTVTQTAIYKLSGVRLDTIREFLEGGVYGRLSKVHGYVPFSAVHPPCKENDYSDNLVPQAVG